MNIGVEQTALTISKGEQSGASILLRLGREYSVGTTLDHDIVLRGAIADNSSLRLVADDNGVVVIDSTSKIITRTKYLDEIHFGSVRFFVNQPEPRAHSSPKPRVASRTSWSAVTHLRVGGLSVIGFVVLAFVFLQYGSQDTPPMARESLESRLLAANLTQLTIDRSQVTSIVIGGYVQSRDQAIRLAEFISLQPESLVNQVYVDEEIKDQILDVLRVNGVPGSVESLGHGAFVANTKWAAGEKLDHLQGLIERDVPSVLSFSVNNVLPEELVLVPEPVVVPIVGAQQTDAGKRVVMVKSDRPAYVVTEDQSRYFIGSLLPGGYRIAAITNGRVMVERKGVKTELKF